MQPDAELTLMRPWFNKAGMAYEQLAITGAEDETAQYACQPLMNVRRYHSEKNCDALWYR
jgi:hypothetical protein